MAPTKAVPIAAATALVVGMAFAVFTGVTGTREARATLPSDLAQSISATQVDRSFDLDPDDARQVVLDDGTEVFLVTGEGGDACIGLADGRAACGSASQVASGRLFLITVAATGRPADQPSPIPPSGSVRATVYGHQPQPGAATAFVLGAEGQVLGRGDVVDGVYRVTITTNARAGRMTEVRFEAADASAAAPPPIELD
jgi:hypothetical protein